MDSSIKVRELDPLFPGEEIRFPESNLAEDIC